MAVRSAFPKKFHEWILLILIISTIGLLVWMIYLNETGNNDDKSYNKWLYTWLAGQAFLGCICYWLMKEAYGADMFASSISNNRERDNLLSNRVHSD